MSFETEAELSLAVPRSELRNVRQQIEDGIGTVEVGISDGASMSAQSTRSDGGRGGQARRSMRLAESRNEYLDDISLYLEDIEDKVGGGGGGGVGGLATEIFGVAGETAGDAAITAGETVADTVKDVLTGAAATALGNTIAEAITNSDVAVEDTAVPVKPNPLPVSGGGSGGTMVSPTINTSTNLSPTFRPTFNPEFSPDFSTELAPEFDFPDLEVGGSPGMVRVDESQLPLAVEEPTLAVEEPTLAVEEPTLAVEFPKRPQSGGGKDPRSLGQFLDATGKRAVAGGVAGGAIGTISPDPFTTAGGALVGGATGITSSIISEAGRRLGGSGSGSSGSVAVGGTTVTNDVDADVSPQFTINVDTDRLLDDVEKAVERAQEEVRRELLDKIEDVEDDLDDLENQITR